MNSRIIVILTLFLFTIIISSLLLSSVIKLSINTEVNGCYCKGLAINNQCLGVCLFATKPHQPSPEDNIRYCEEGIRGNTCIKCECNTDKDCKLVTNPYVISECAEKEVVSKKTSDSCLINVRNNAINATCVVPENYAPPEYEIVCINQTCGKVLK